jgi:hypothetical protein
MPSCVRVSAGKHLSVCIYQFGIYQFGASSARSILCFSELPIRQVDGAAFARHYTPAISSQFSVLSFHFLAMAKNLDFREYL